MKSGGWIFYLIDIVSFFFIFLSFIFIFLVLIFDRVVFEGILWISD